MGNRLIENISNIYKRIFHAALKAGRSPEEIRLIAVTKSVGVETIKEALDAGLRDFGESRVQEAQRKISEPGFQISNEIRWHMIGHLQKNKAKAAVMLFDLIHSIDSAGLLEEVERQAKKIGKTQKVLIEVKLSAEDAKHGIPEGQLIGLLRAGEKMKNVSIEGLMTIPPYSEEPEGSRPYYRELRKLRDDAQKEGFGLPELSMGMTGDFEVAVEEGATMVRVGTAIFGGRELG